MVGQHIKEALAPVIFLVAIVGLVALILGLTDCKPPAPGALPAYCTEESLYTAALLRCVDKAETLAESKQCRASVDYSCGIIQTITVKK